MSKRLIPLSEPLISGNEWQYIKRCLDTSWVSSAGSFVSGFESAISKKFKVNYAVACINATSGLFIALKLSGVCPGDEVILPTLTFIAPVNAVSYQAADPVFMDCDDYMNLAPEKLADFCKKECVLTSRGLKNKKSAKLIKAIIPVHVFGNPCNLEAIISIAEKYRLTVIEDAAESIGSYYTRGAYKKRFTGAIGDLGVYSFNGNKIITAGGGGMILTNNETFAEKARYLVNQAKNDPVRYIHNEVGYNFRLNNLQSALGMAQLELLDKYIKIKKFNYDLYRNMLQGLEGLSLLDVPEGTSPNYWFYSLIIDKKKLGMDRETLMRKLTECNIQTRPLWYLNHLQKPFRKNQSYKIEKAFWFLDRVLNIPCSTALSHADIKTVVSAIKKLQGR